MTSLDVLYYALAIGFLVLVGFISYAMYHLGQTLKLVSHITEDVEDITHDIHMTKEKVKLRVIDGLLGILRMFRKAT